MYPYPLRPSALLRKATHTAVCPEPSDDHQTPFYTRVVLPAYHAIQNALATAGEWATIIGPPDAPMLAINPTSAREAEIVFGVNVQGVVPVTTYCMDSMTHTRRHGRGLFRSRPEGITLASITMEEIVEHFWLVYRSALYHRHSAADHSQHALPTPERISR